MARIESNNLLVVCPSRAVYVGVVAAGVHGDCAGADNGDCAGGGVDGDCAGDDTGSLSGVDGVE